MKRNIWKPRPGERFDGRHLAGLAVVAAMGVPSFALGQSAHLGAQEKEEGRAASRSNLVLEEIMVTAQRREQSLARTAVAVSALGTEGISRLQINDTRDIIANVPNLTGNSNIGQSTAVAFFMRGIGTTENLGTADPSIGVYVDDVYVARQAVNNFKMFDIERIEVLRGPQGTLYGRNTNGGAIRIVTKKPHEEAEGYVSGSYGEFDSWDLKLSGNVPLSDKVFVSSSFLIEQSDGTKENLTLDRDVDDKDYLGGRIALRALPSDTVIVDVAVDYSRDKTNGGYATDIAGIRSNPTGDLRKVISGTENKGDAETFGVSANVSLDLNDSFTLTSISGYRFTEQNLFLDLSGQPVSFFELDQDQESNQFSQELQLDGQLGQLHITAGLYYFREDADAALSMDIIGAQDPLIAPTTFANVMEVDIESYAAFAQLEYAIGSVTLVAGGRYTRDERDIVLNATSSIPGPTFNFDTAALIAQRNTGQDVDPNRSFDKFTPKIGVNWQINEDLFSYVSFAKGFRSAGWTGRAVNVNQYVNVPPENVDSWELGLKAQLLDGRVQWNNVGFFTKYKDLFNTLTINGIFTVQAADAEIYGLESELAVQANEWVRLFANVGLLDTKYTGEKPLNLAPELQRAPNFQGKAGFNIDYPYGDGYIMASADIFYTSSYLTQPADLSVTAPLVDPDIVTTGDFALVNALLGYRFGEEERYQVTLSCTNCFDKDYFDASTVIGGFAAVYAGPPRIAKLSAMIKF